jgi:hypothetical protein
MTYNEVKAVLASQMSVYMTDQTAVMRRGKYTAGMHYRDGFIAMLFETITEIDEVTEEYDPLTKENVRTLIRAFNRLTTSTVPNIWVDSI